MTSIKRTSRISIYIRKKVSNELIEWLNTRKEIGPAILDVLEKNVSSEYIHISEIDKYVTASNILFDKKIDKYEKEITKLESVNDKNKVLLKDNEKVEEITVDIKEDTKEDTEIIKEKIEPAKEIKREIPQTKTIEDNSDLSFEEQMLLEQHESSTEEIKHEEVVTSNQPKKNSGINMPFFGVTDQTN